MKGKGTKREGKHREGKEMKVRRVWVAPGAELGFRTEQFERPPYNLSVFGATCLSWGVIFGAQWVLKEGHKSEFGHHISRRCSKTSMKIK